MTDYKAIRTLHELLKNKSHWFIDPYSPDEEQLKSICQKAKEYSDHNLSRVSTLVLFLKYKIWRRNILRNKWILPPNEEYFDSFISQVADELGCKSLQESEKDLYNRNCYLTVKFI